MSAVQIIPPASAPAPYRRHVMERHTISKTVERVETVEPERKATARPIDDAEPQASCAARFFFMAVLLVAAAGFGVVAIAAFVWSDPIIAAVFLVASGVSAFGYFSLAGYE